jgi:hypothetical protein
MTQTFHGIVEIKDTGRTIRLDGNEGDIVVLKKRGGQVFEMMKFDGSSGSIVVQSSPGREAVRVDCSPPTLYVGSDQAPGDLVIGNFGNVVVRDHLGRDILKLGGTKVALTMGGNGRDGRVTLLSDESSARINLDADRSNVWVGGNGQDGDVVLFSRRVTDTDNANLANIHLDGDTGTIHLGDSDGRDRLHLRPDSGALYLSSDDGYEGIKLDPMWGLKLGGNGRDGRIHLYSREVTDLTQDTSTIYIDAYTGDIVFRNADCAEEFDISEAEEADAGTVMVIEQEDKLRQSTKAYDKRVAGVISGAADCKPGIILGRRPSGQKTIPLALTGKVFCKADADYSPIAVGDLLTTSATAGYAMKAIDPIRSFGAVIGKALKPLPEGRGLIPILVALQ